LKLFTFLPLPKIAETMIEHNAAPEKRVAQHLLAGEFVELVHGFDEAEKAQQQHRSMFSKNSGSDTNESTWEQHPNTTLPRSMVIGRPFSAVLWSAGLADSKSEATRLIKNKGAYIHAPESAEASVADSGFSFAQLDNPTAYLEDSHLSKRDDGREFLILRSGKRKVRVVRLVSDEEFEEIMKETAVGKIEEST
jgi:tyrosyl-tRNA synthetase